MGQQSIFLDSPAQRLDAASTTVVAGDAMLELPSASGRRWIGPQDGLKMLRVSRVACVFCASGEASMSARAPLARGKSCIAMLLGLRVHVLLRRHGACGLGGCGCKFDVA